MNKNTHGSTNCTYCSPINEKIVEVHEHPSGLFGVGLLVEVSIEVAQLKIRFKIHNQTPAMLVCDTASPGMQKKSWSYHWSGIELGDDVVEEGCEVGGARLELLDAVKAVALAV